MIAAMAQKRSRATFESDATSVLYGTPLPPLDPDVRDDGSYVPIWKQDATDERGRKRFHGAFTGGFSAGYFNTVGSAEGWAPRSFVSSRSKRCVCRLASSFVLLLLLLLLLLSCCSVRLR